MKKVCLGGYGKLKYELYEDGTVVSVGHISSRGYEVRDRILTYSMRNGYKCVTMNLDGKSKYYYLHRLLAQNFIENPNDYPCVNHVDGNKLNNDIANLEWCTYSQNNKHAFTTGLKAPTILRHEAHGGRKLTEKDIELLGNIVKIKPLDKKGKTIEIIEGGVKVGSKEYLFTQEGK